MTAAKDSASLFLSGIAAVTKQSLVEQVHRALCESLMRGQLPPGQRVPLRSIAAAMGTSIMPVRESVNRLVAVRALEVLPNRRISVPVLTESEYAEISSAKVLVESAAAREAAARITDSAVSKLQSLHEAMMATIKADHSVANNQKYLTLNKEFHFLIYAAAGSEALMKQIEFLWLRVGPYFHLLHEPNTSWRGNENHEQIISAIKSRNAEKVSAAVRSDLEGAASYILSHNLL